MLRANHVKANALVVGLNTQQPGGRARAGANPCLRLAVSEKHRARFRNSLKVLQRDASVETTRYLFSAFPDGFAKQPHQQQHEHGNHNHSHSQTQQQHQHQQREEDGVFATSAANVSQVFDQASWERHREPARYFRAVFGFYSSTVLRRVVLPCMLPVACAIASCLVNFPATAATQLPFSVGGSLISLLLVFRTNSGYGRYVEGRILWGTMLNTLRDMARIAASYSTSDATVRKLATRIICLAECFSWLLKDHLRKGRNVGFGKFALPEDHDSPAPRVLEALEPMGEDGLCDAKLLLADGAHGPLVCMLLLTDAVKSFIKLAEMPLEASTELQKAITVLGGVLGGSERILKTPIPLSYTRHTSRTLFMFLCLLPLTLRPVMGWSCVPAIFLLSYALVGVDEIGVEVEEPFATLPLTSICRSVRDNLAALRTLMGHHYRMRADC